MARLLGYCFGRTLDGVIRVASVFSQLMKMGGKGFEAHLIGNQQLAQRNPLPGFTYYQCPPDARAIAAKMAELVERVSPELLLVDAYPLGIANELPNIIPSIPSPVVLLLGATNAPPPLVTNVEAMVRDLYDISIAPGDFLPFHDYGRVLHVDPIVAAEPEEFIDQVDARKQLKYAGKPIFVFHDSAGQGARTYERLRAECLTCGGLRIEWRIATQDKSLETRFAGQTLSAPSLLTLASALGAVVSLPTYAQVHEAVCGGVPALFLPFKGDLEMLNRRAGPNLILDENALVRTILSGEIPESRTPSRLMGAKQAAKALRPFVRHKLRYSTAVLDTAGTRY